jgi:glycosyltransferase involved in cell wall biosynthesis
MRASSGDYVAFLDADDSWQPAKLQVQLDVAARNPNSGLIACDGVRRYGTDVVQEPLLFGPIEWRMRAQQKEEITGHFYRDFIRGVPICSSSQMLIPRRVATRVGPMVTRADADGASDWDYTLRIARQFPVTLHRHPLVSYRVHGESLSGIFERRQVTHALRRIRVLQRHRRLCAPEDRALVEERFLAEVRQAAYRAYGEGRNGQRAFARHAFWQLVRRAPWEPRVWVAFAAMWFPQRLVSGMSRRSPRRIGGFAGKGRGR